MLEIYKKKRKTIAVIIEHYISISLLIPDAKRKQGVRRYEGVWLEIWM